METQAWQDLTNIIADWVNPKEEYFGIGEIIDAEDGSGEQILVFPEGLCEKVGWKEGDTLVFETDGEEKLILRKKQQ